MCISHLHSLWFWKKCPSKSKGPCTAPVFSVFCAAGPFLESVAIKPTKIVNKMPPLLPYSGFFSVDFWCRMVLLSNILRMKRAKKTSNFIANLSKIAKNVHLLAYPTCRVDGALVYDSRYYE